MYRHASVVPLARLSKAGTAYTYAVPEWAGRDIRLGQLVRIPFRERSVAGVVVDLPETPAYVAGLRDLISIGDIRPVLATHQLELAAWIRDEYRAPWSDVLGAMLPPVLKKATGESRKPTLNGALVLTPAGQEAVGKQDRARRAPRQQALLLRLADAGGTLLERTLVKDIGAARGSIAALQRAGLVERTLLVDGDEPQQADQAPTLSAAQTEAVATILGDPSPNRVDEQCRTEARGSRADFRVVQRRDSGGATVSGHAPTTPAKQESLSEATTVYLLHGVTGSGKTEVYMAVIEEVVRRGLGAIVMVPEISLTPQALKRFIARFPGLVATIHSELSQGQRRAEWQRLRSGEARIAVGPRSAVFAPLQSVGVIIVDEEHDGSYKQDESPRYHARDVAIKLGGMLGIPVILGSATPDVCSYYHARKGRYTLLSLPDRPVWAGDKESHVQSSESRSQNSQLHEARGNGEAASTLQSPVPMVQAVRPSGFQGQQPGGPVSVSSDAPLRSPSRAMPSVEIVDLKQELKAGNRTIFSRSLLAALEETLAARHQALLFLNRRGSATSVVCRQCGHVATCGACDIPLTFHSTNPQLICHRCNRRWPAPRRCPVCRGDQIRYLGVGTQKLVEEVERALPTATVLRWDRDVTSKKGAHAAIAGVFDRHEADILVGTQMIAKGLDFPLVTLVGVVVADIGLNFPDFRAAERAFQLMTQVAGRAGRAKLPSRVIIQSYNPEHYALRAAQEHDYWNFYRQEMTFRHEAGYPPYRRLVRFVLKGKDDQIVGRRAHELRDTLLSTGAEQGPEALQLIGPAPSFIARVDNIYQWHLLALGRDVRGLLDIVPEDVIVDVDPVDVL